MDEASYSETDVKKIIQRALELQKREKEHQAITSGSDSGEFTLHDIEQTAKEIGLENDLVHRAAMEIQGGARSSFLKRFLGSETEIAAIGRDDTATSNEALQELAVTMQTITGFSGTGSAQGSVCSWVTSRADVEQRGFPTQITVRSVTSGTVVEIRERLGQLAAGLYGGLMGGVGLGAGLGVGLGVGLGKLGSGGAAAIIATGTFVASYGLARLIFTSVAARRRRETRVMLKRILSFLRDRRTEG
jgi:hypothetical protein